jgi:alpha-L-fucosidase
MNRRRIPASDYEKLASRFDPEKFNADEWVALAKNAGMKYITITAKHHDGFAMYGSKVNPYNIVDATPFHRDVLKELAAACQRAGIKLCFYYSQTQDWHEADGYGNDWDWPDRSKKDFQKYYDEKVVPQLRELLTDYGPIGLIWFDTPRNMTFAQSQKLADLVHQLQPQCLVSGRVGHDLGDYDSAGDNEISVGPVKRPWETPVTMNNTWGFKKDDHDWKPAGVLIRQLATTSSRGGNYLLNVGPTAEGVIPEESVERLGQVGEWMKRNNEAIYGTLANPFPYDLPWGVITTKPGRLYLHVFQWPQKPLVIYGLENKVLRAWLVADRTRVRFAQKQDKKNGYTSLTLKLAARAPDASDSVIALDVSGNVCVDGSLLQQPDRSITLQPSLGELHRSGDSDLELDSRGAIEGWTRAGDWVDWRFKVNHPGSFDVELVTSETRSGYGRDGGQQVTLEVGSQKLEAKLADDGKEQDPTDPYWLRVISRMGRIRLAKPGAYQAALKTTSIPPGQRFGLTLVQVRLVPAHLQSRVK